MDAYQFFYETILDPIVYRDSNAIKSITFTNPPKFQLIGKAVFQDFEGSGELYALEFRKIPKKGFVPQPPVAYEGFGEHEGEWVAAQDALAYAMKQCGIVHSGGTSPEQREFDEMLVEWYFSGNWRAVREGDREYGEG